MGENMEPSIDIGCQVLPVRMKSERQAATYSGAFAEADRNKRSFYSFIQGGKNPAMDKADFATFEDGHFSMCITDAILESAASGQWVKLTI